MGAVQGPHPAEPQQTRAWCQLVIEIYPMSDGRYLYENFSMELAVHGRPVEAACCQLSSEALEQKPVTT